MKVPTNTKAAENVEDMRGDKHEEERVREVSPQSQKRSN